MPSIKKESFGSLVQIWLKSTKVFAADFWQIGIIIIITSAISSLALYPISGYLQAVVKDPEALKEVKFLPVAVTLIVLILNQMLLSTAITFLVLFKSNNIFYDLERIIGFIRGKFIKLFLACFLKTILNGIGLALFIIPGFIVFTALSLVEFLILIEDRGIVESAYKSLKIVGPFFWPLFIFISLFYSTPMLFLKSVLYFAILALCTINMLIIYMKHRD